MTWKIIPGFSVLFALAMHCGAATYYVDSAGGNDANSGTATNAAWQSVAKVNATTFAPGDVILFKAGGSWLGSLNPKGSGTAGNAIVIDRYGDGNKPLIDGNGVNGTGTTGGGAVFLYNQQYWEINHLEIVNDAVSDGERRGIHIAAANFGTVNHIHIKNCNIHDIRGRLSVTDGDLIAKRTGGIIVEVISDSPVATRFNDVLIEGNTITTVRNQGIVAAGNRSGQSDFPLTPAWNTRRASNLIIRSNTISDVTKNALILRLADNTCLVEWNVCFNTATLDTGNTMFTAACDGVIFQFNEGYENHAGPLGDHDGSLYDADLRSTSITFQYSYSHDNAHGLFWQYPSASGPNSNIVVRYNISRNDRGNIFSFSGDSGGDATTYIYNNTIYLPPGSSNLICDARSGNHTYFMSNNIFYLAGTSVAYDFGSNTRAFDYNTFYGFHPVSEPPDAHKLTNDPLLVAPGSGTNGIGSLAGYKLQAGSPAIDSGATIGNNGGRDFFGNTLPQNGATDRGTHEFVALATTNPPSISQQPQSLTVTNGNSANFAVTVTGTAPLAYQWRKGGAPIGGATGTNLFFAVTSTNDAGSYDVVITNVAGSVTSSVATLTVVIPSSGTPPTITTNPQSQSVIVGANVTFTAAASGTALLTFQWRKGGNAVPSATNTSLALSSVTTNDAGSFDVVVTNDFGAVTSSVATLTVTVPGVGVGVVIAEVYNGGGKTGATFNRDYVVLKNASAAPLNIANWSLQHDKAGVWQTPFVFTNVTVPAGGYYLVQCYFDGGTASGATPAADAATTQSSAWNFSTTSAGAVALVNNAATLTTCASSNIVDLVGWVATAGNCYEGLGVPGAGSATSSNQRLANGCQDTDSNTNDFVLATPTGRSSSTTPAPCSGCSAPAISSQPTNVTVSAGFIASFTVIATGTAPGFQWRKNGSPIGGATAAALNFSSAATNDTGSFDVVITNACGSITSTVAVLTVTADPPIITSDPQSQQVSVGAPASLTIAVIGSLPLDIQWRKAGVPIPSATNSALSFAAVTTNDFASYDAVVTNRFGVDVSNAATLSAAPTNQPPSITSQPLSQNVFVGATVTFSVTASGAAPLSYRWRKNGVNMSNATNATHSLTSVTTNDAGGFSVVVTNAFGAVTSAVATLTVTPVGTNSNVNPADYINPRFANVTVTSGVKFADVINYKGVSTSLYLDVYQPTGDTNTSRPAIVWIHGGGFRTGSSRTQSYIVTYATEFAKRGYVCFSIDYRLRSGSDMPTQESELPAEQDGAADCNTAFNWLRTNAPTYLINTNWLFVGGGSAGGRIANVFSLHEGPDTNVCNTCSSAILTNGVNLVPPVNWNRSGLIANASLWGAPEPVMRWYVLQSNDTPTVIIHGTADATIDYQNALDLYAGLTNVGATVELDPLVGYGHTPTSANSQIIPWVANFFAGEWTKKLASSETLPPQVYPIQLRAALLSTNGMFRVSFTNVSGASFTILRTPDITLPVVSWTALGVAQETAPGQYEFTDSVAVTNVARYYRAMHP